MADSITSPLQQTNRLLILAVCLLVFGRAQFSAAEASEKISYNFQIRPLLAANCYQCHGPDEKRRKKELRLDDRDTALKKNTIVPGHADDSKLIKRILSDDPEEIMPPPETHRTLSAAEKDLL